MGVNHGETDLSSLIMKNISSQMLTQMGSAVQHCYVLLRHYKNLILDGEFMFTCRLFRIDCAREKFYAVDEKEKDKIVKELSSKRNPKINI